MSMVITKRSSLTGIEHTREIAVTPEQLQRWLRGGVFIQVAMPHLSPDDREFLMTGITPDEWDNAFGEEEEDEND